MLTKDISLDNPGTLGLGNVRFSVGEDGVAIIGVSIVGEESNKPLLAASLSKSGLEVY